MTTTVTYKGSTIATVDNNTKTLTTQGKYLEADVVLTDVSIAAPTLQTKSVSITPSTSAQSQTVTYDSGYDGLDEVTVNVSAMPSGTTGTPTATKGTVANHSVTITPSVTNATGYIIGSTIVGTPITVTADELISFSTVRTGSTVPSDSVGIDGDIYLQIS